MKNETDFFVRKRVDEDRLRNYGFTEENGSFFFSKKLLDGQFLMEVHVKGSEILTRLLDVENECEYTLHIVSNAQGEFVGKVRIAYEDVLSHIRDKCFVDDVFKSETAKAVIRYVAEKYDTPLEFLWKKFPDNAVYRRKDNQKWYAAILTVAKSKIGLDGAGNVEILDLRIEPAQMEQTIDNKKFFPGYHMNKKSWYTICLDGSVEEEEIFKRIDVSYELAKKKQGQKIF